MNSNESEADCLSLQSSYPFVRPFPVQNRWCVHSYYTISPYAPDGSGRLLLAGAYRAQGTRQWRGTVYGRRYGRRSTVRRAYSLRPARHVVCGWLWRRLLQAGGSSRSLHAERTTWLIQAFAGSRESDLVLSTADILAIIRQLHLPRVLGDTEAPGRNRYRVCHHPVFSRDGGKLLVNTLEGRDAVVCEIDMAAALGD